MGGTWRSPRLGLCFFTTNSEHPPAAVRRTTAQDEHLTHRRLCPAPTTSALVARTPCRPRPRIHLWLITSRPNWMLRATWRSPCLDLLCFFTTNSEHPPAAVRRTTAQDEHLTHRRLCPAPTTSALVARTPCRPRPRIHLWLITSRPNWMLRATWRSPCLDLLCFFTTNSEHPPAAVHRATTQDEHLTCHAWHFLHDEHLNTPNTRHVR